MKITNSLFPIGGAYPYVKQLNQSLQKLQVQLATQEKAQTLSELGSNRVYDLTLRSRLSRLDAFKANIDTATLRLDFLDNSVNRLIEIQSDSRGSLSASGVGEDGIEIASASEIAYNRLDEITAILNGDLNGRYMFAGNQTDAEPVVTADILINGDGSRAGLKTMISERKRADAGGLTAYGDASNGIGRLTINQIQLSATNGAPGDVVISESVTPNGPALTDVDATGMTNVAAPPLAVGPPASTTVTFAGQPNPGETLTVTVQQPGGTPQPMIFTAVAGTPANPGEFQIGADANATAANFQAAFGGMFQANSVTLAEDGVHDYGIKLDGATTDSLGISIAAQTTAQPHALQITVDAQPAEGQKLKISYTLPDGTKSSFELVATTSSPPGRGEFEIGADADATAANIGTAMATQLDYVRQTDLAAASANKATEQFITTDGSPPMRVDGPPFDTATAEIAGTIANNKNTVQWYTGQSAAGNAARQTVGARVDESTTAYFGVLGNEAGIADLIRANAVMAAETFSANEVGGADRYQATATRQVSRIAAANNGRSGSLNVISLELGLSRAKVGSTSERHAAYSGQLETMLSEVEAVDVNEVAMQLLAVRTNLEASYQTMSRLSSLTLVNYMP